MKMEDLKVKQISIETQEKTKQIEQQEKTRQLEIEQHEKTRQLEIEQQEKTKQLEIEQQQKTKQLEIQRQIVEQKEKTRQMELQLESKKLDMKVTQDVTPCTIDNVCKTFKLLDDITDERLHNKILVRAGKIAKESSSILTLLPEKYKASDSSYEVNQYAPHCTTNLMNIIRTAKIQEQNHAMRQASERISSGSRCITDMLVSNK
jgi:hypothetical protein